MENNIENKYSFFAQYWNVEAHKIISKPYIYKVGINGLFVGEFDYLVLKPLSLITDEDAVSLSKIEFDFYTENHKVRGKNIANWISDQETFSHCLPNFYKSAHALDFLRSKGYAVRYMGLSIEMLIKYGWIKLIENAKD